MNNGDGSFGSPLLIGQLLYTYHAMTAADVNGDGDLDIVSVNANYDVVVILPNNGNGTFGAESLYSVGARPTNITLSDLDNDGDLDLAAGSSSSGNISVFLNDGDGTFDSYSTYPAGELLMNLFAADIDNDGDIDLITPDRPDSVCVLLNNGHASFVTHSLYSGDCDPRSVFVNDLNGDARLDLIVCCDGKIIVHLNKGGGNFAEALPYPVDFLPFSKFFVADLDSDGDVDVAITSSHDSLYVLPNRGFRTINIFSASNIYVGGSIKTLVADLDGDGDNDIIAQQTYINDGNGVFVPYDPLGLDPTQEFHPVTSLPI